VARIDVFEPPASEQNWMVDAIREMEFARVTHEPTADPTHLIGSIK
jgi:hypothetical protein